MSKTVGVLSETGTTYDARAPGINTVFCWGSYCSPSCLSVLCLFLLVFMSSFCVLCPILPVSLGCALCIALWFSLAFIQCNCSIVKLPEN